MKKWKSLLLAACLLCGVCGCAGTGRKENDNTVTGIVIQKDGSIVHTIYEDFTESYYSVDGLGEMIEQTVQSYKKKNPKAQISLEQCELQDGQGVKVKMLYDSCDTYSDFNDCRLFIGTIQQAYEAGWNLDYYLSSVSGKEQSTITKQELLNLSDHYIVITDEVIEVEVNDKIIFATDTVEMLGKKKVMMKQAHGMNAIVFK